MVCPMRAQHLRFRTQILIVRRVQSWSGPYFASPSISSITTWLLRTLQTVDRLCSLSPPLPLENNQLWTDTIAPPPLREMACCPFSLRFRSLYIRTSSGFSHKFCKIWADSGPRNRYANFSATTVVYYYTNGLAYEPLGINPGRHSSYIWPLYAWSSSDTTTTLWFFYQQPYRNASNDLSKQTYSKTYVLFSLRPGEKSFFR